MINITDLPRRWRVVAHRTCAQEEAVGRGEGGRPFLRQRLWCTDTSFTPLKMVNRNFRRKSFPKSPKKVNKNFHRSSQKRSRKIAPGTGISPEKQNFHFKFAQNKFAPPQPKSPGDAYDRGHAFSMTFRKFLIFLP